jgi:hypothetical protein
MFFSNIKKQQIWLKLGTNSRRAISKRIKKWGHPYIYKPRSDLIANLSYELKLPTLEINLLLEEMRQEILR